MRYNRREKLQAFVPVAIQGLNIGIMAIGSSGSGKSHTFEGTKSEHGVIPLFVSGLLTALSERAEACWNRVLIFGRLSPLPATQSSAVLSLSNLPKSSTRRPQISLWRRRALVEPSSGRYLIRTHAVSRGWTRGKDRAWRELRSIP